MAADPQAIDALNIPAPGDATDARRLSQNFDETVSRRVAFLTGYQDAAYAARYRERVERAKAAEAEKAPGQCGLAEAVARNLFKLMAYKDEYEVARLYSDGAFLRQAAAEFDGKLRFTFHLAPPLLARRDPATGEPRKMTFGPWMMRVFALLAKLKVLRGTAFDPFGRSEERRSERRLVAEYEAMLDEVLPKLTPDNHHLAVGIAAIPEKIRGFGHVKARHLAAAKADEAVLLDQFRSGTPHLLKAAE
jgi:indolepyruvate ferredoxin oxidoreductase